MHKMRSILVASTAMIVAWCGGAAANELPDGAVQCGKLGVLNLEGSPCSVWNWFRNEVLVPAGTVIPAWIGEGDTNYGAGAGVSVGGLYGSTSGLNQGWTAVQNWRYSPNDWLKTSTKFSITIGERTISGKIPPDGLFRGSLVDMPPGGITVKNPKTGVTKYIDESGKVSDSPPAPGGNTCGACYDGGNGGKN